MSQGTLSQSLRMGTLSFPSDAVTQTLLVLGGKGMGKTNFGAVLAEELATARQRFAVLDPVGVWYGLAHDGSGKGPGIEVLVLGGRHGDLPLDPTAGPVIADLVADEDVPVVVDISRRADGRMWSVGEQTRFVTAFSTRLYERQGEKRQPVHLLFDEAGRFVPQQIPHGNPDLAACVGAIERLVELGRNVGIGVTLITQRSARINKSVAELAECLVAFRTVGPNSVDAVVSWLGEHVARSEQRSMVEKLRSLPRGHALVVSPGWLEIEKVCQIRHRGTFDTSGTPKAGQAQPSAKGKATVDLSRYKDRMAEVVERAQADDPKALRRRIAELEREVAKKPAPPAKVERVEVAIIKDAQVASLAASVEKLSTIAGTVMDKADELGAALAKAGAPEIRRRAVVHHKGQPVDHELALIVGDGDTATGAKIVAEKVNLNLPAFKEGTIKPGWETIQPKPWPAITWSRAPASPSAASDGPVPKGELAILRAVALAELMGIEVDRTFLSVMTSYKKSSRDSYVARAQGRGLLTADLRLTAKGHSINAAQAMVDLPKPGEDLLGWWLGRLPEGEVKILRLVAAAEDAVPRETLSERTGYMKSSRDSYIARLAAKSLVVVARRGVLLSPFLRGAA